MRLKEPHLKKNHHAILDSPIQVKKDKNKANPNITESEMLPVQKGENMATVKNGLHPVRTTELS